MSGVVVQVLVARDWEANLEEEPADEGFLSFRNS